MDDACERIAVHSNICHGKPHIKGTRVMVAQVLDLLEGGKTFEEIIARYFPSLTTADIQACVHFAKALVTNEDIHLAESAR